MPPKIAIFNLPSKESRRTRTVLVAILAVASLAGCGSVSEHLSGGTGGSTAVTVFVSAKANDQLSNFFLTLNSLTLTTDTGQQVNLFAAPQYVEFLHLNAKPEPLATFSIPQGVYTSATATAGSGGGNFLCYGFDPATGDLVTSIFQDQQVPESGVTVNMQPVTISGATSALMLEMQVTQSAHWPTCNSYQGTQPWSITPSFVLSAASNNDPAVNKTRGLRGLVTEIDPGGTGFSITSAEIQLWGMSPPGPVWHISLNGSEVYGGIAGISQLAVGMPVDVDASAGKGGSLLASRVSVYDANPNGLTVSTGPLLRIWASAPYLYTSAVYAQGALPAAMGAGAPYSFGSSAFQISSELTNLSDLPFSASFTAANAVAGQNVFISTHALGQSPSPIFFPATTVTLLPQTVDGTVSAIGSEGGFTTYTVTLAPYDLFPALAVQPGQNTLLANPNTVVVYADSNTQMLNTNPVAVGSLGRFYGLVFDDNGTLRMDCARILDGVAE